MKTRYHIHIRNIERWVEGAAWFARINAINATVYVGKGFTEGDAVKAAARKAEAGLNCNIIIKSN